MPIQGGGRKAAPSLKNKSVNSQINRQKRGSVREAIGYRFFFTLFLACIVCVSFSAPDFTEPLNGALAARAPDRDFKLSLGPRQQAPQIDNTPDVTDARRSLTAQPGLKYADAPVISGVSTISGASVISGASAISGATTADGVVAAKADAEVFPLNTAITPQRANTGAGYVIMDAGHGGADPGCDISGLFEKDITLDIALMAAAVLDEAGVDYILTRGGDETVTVEQRINLMGPEAAFFVSLHCDWYKQEQINGTSSLYYADDETSKQLAVLLQSHMVCELGTGDRGVHPRRDVTLLRDARRPAVIVELAFLSNTRDLSLINTPAFREKAARNLASGIIAALRERPAVLSR